MTGSSRLAAHRAAASAEPVDPEIPVEEDEDEGELTAKPKPKKDLPMTDTSAEAIETARTEAAAAATAAAKTRFDAVLASEHYAGREALAKTLLATDLTADQITKALADAPKPGAADQDVANAAAEAAARDEMKKALDETSNSDIAAGNEGKKPDTRAEIDSIWDRARGLNKGA